MHCRSCLETSVYILSVSSSYFQEDHFLSNIGPAFGGSLRYLSVVNTLSFVARTAVLKAR